MAVQVSQQYVQVVGTPNQEGALRVYRVYVDVLVKYTPPIEGPVSSTLTLSDGVTFVGLMNGPTSDTLSLVSTATAARNLPVSASSNITLVSLGGRVRTGELEDVLVLFQLVLPFNLVEDRAPVGNILNFVQTVTSLASLDALHDLALTQNVAVQAPYKPQVSHRLNIYQTAPTPYHFWVEHALPLSHFINTPLPTQHITDTMHLTAGQRSFDSASHVLGISDTAVYAKSLTATNYITLTDTLAMIAIWVRPVEHDNVVGHALTWYEDSPCGRKQYTPFRGESTLTSDVGPPRDDLQDPQGDTQNFSIYTPYLGVHTNEVVMRKPEMDNRDRNAYTRISQETRGGKVVVYADPIWPKVRTLAVTIVGLTETKVDELQSFMQDTIGQQIGLTDWEGRMWQGYITNPNEAATQDGKARWTVSFLFDGEMLDVEQPGSDDGAGMAMNLAQSVTAVIV